MNFNIHNDISFSNLITDVIQDESNELYDNNQYENVIDMQSFNQNTFTNLHKLFNDEHDRIFNIYCVNPVINEITDKVKKDIQEIDINYDSKTFLEECKKANDKDDEDIKNSLDIDFDLDKFKISIHNLRNYYSKLNIETFKLENEIIEILKKYDVYYSKMKSIFNNLNEFENIDEHINNIDKEICSYITKYFKTKNLDDKFKLYKSNVKKLRLLKKYINEINSINFIPYCNICMNKIVDSVIIPCGHTACHECLSKCEMKCFICRNSITNIGKLFIN